MIPVRRVIEPAEFDIRARKRGREWLKQNAASSKRLPDYWSEFTPALANGFHNLCGYAAMLDPTGGTVDHYLSTKNHRQLAYEWRNYRFASAVLNASKKDADDLILDPYEVKDGWFEILLPSLIMQATKAVPAKLRRKAEYTLDRLQLRSGERVIRWRQSWYNSYMHGELNLDGLRRYAPLIAAAIEREQTKGGSRS